MILLAKKTKNTLAAEYEATLEGHTLFVIRSFKTIFGASDKPSEFALKWLAFFNITNMEFNSFYFNGLFACLFHDIGKVNSTFQKMISGKGRQLVRHEHFSGIIMHDQSIKSWIDDFQYCDFSIILSAVVCHHLKTPVLNKNFAEYLPDTDNCRFSIDKKALEMLFKNIAKAEPELKNFCVELSLPEKWNFNDEGSKGYLFRKKAKQALSRFGNELEESDKSKMLMAVKAALIIADSAGSGLTREKQSLDTWLKSALLCQNLQSSDIQKSIIQKRIDEIESVKGKKFQWNKFQEEIEKLPDKALLISACGTGKTLAAWRWIKSRLRNRKATRAIFLYPTKATACEGFKDYVSWAPEASLIHSSAAFDLEEMFDVNDLRNNNDYHVDDRLFALAYWNRKVFSSTVHQFLGFMQNSYKSICLLPLLADSVIVVDEVHSFDIALFAALKKFISNFSLPILCMTATLPPARLDDMTELGFVRYPEKIDQFKELERIAKTSRYYVEFTARESAESIASDAFYKDKKVLWVVNTVDRCQQLARKFDAICYHSRFKQEHRKKIHSEVIQAFGNSSKPVIAITTQVCEMSLDLDADVLITEEAPITSLIQRMGRCNRHLNKSVGEVFIYKPDKQLPYDHIALSGCDDFVKSLDKKTVSQVDLEELLEKYGDNSIEIERFNAFTDSLPWAVTSDLTDNNEYSVQAILDTDIHTYWQKKNNKQPIDNLLIPVPRYPSHLTSKNERIGSFPMIAKSANYDEKLGFLNSPLELII